MGITQKDLARDLGISLITVNRTFNNSGYVSEELKKRILAYAREKGYVPHRASQILVRNKLQTIGIFSSAYPNYFWEDIKKGVLSAAEHIKPFNYEVHYHQIPDADTAYYIKRVQEEIHQGMDAAAFVNQWLFDMEAILGLVEEAGIPYILYNVDNPYANRLCYIGSDYCSGGRLAANFMGKALGIKNSGRILVINIIEDFDSGVARFINSERLRGFQEKMKTCYPETACYLEYLDPKLSVSINQQLGGFLKKYTPPVDAVYCIPAVNEDFLQALEQYQHPQTLSVLHDIDDSALRYLDMNILTAVVYQDPILQGYTAVRTLENILESKVKTRQKDIEIVHNLIFKENINFLRKPYILTFSESPEPFSVTYF